VNLYAIERYQLLLKNSDLQKEELNTLRERNIVLQEQAGHRELAMSQVRLNATYMNFSETHFFFY
jgi:hypothetical protein